MISSDIDRAAGQLLTLTGEFPHKLIESGTLLINLDKELVQLKAGLEELIIKWDLAWADGYMTGIPKIDSATSNRASAKGECANDLRMLLERKPAIAPPQGT